MLTSLPTHAIVMASGINRIPLYAGYQPGYKALLEFDGKPAIAYVLDALNGLPQIEHIHIVGAEEALHDAVARTAVYERCAFVAGGETLLESLMHGLQSCQECEAALFVTADLPLLTTPMLDAFLRNCAQTPSSYRENVHIAGVPQSCFTGAFTRMSKPFSRYRDVSVCPGNLGLVSPGILRNEAAMERINAIYQARKTAVGSAMAFGLRVGLSYVLGVHCFHLLTLAQMAQIASTRFHFGILPVLLHYPEVVIDVDEPDDYLLVQNILSERKRNAEVPVGV